MSRSERRMLNGIVGFLASWTEFLTRFCSDHVLFVYISFEKERAEMIDLKILSHLSPGKIAQEKRLSVPISYR